MSSTRASFATTYAVLVLVTMTVFGVALWAARRQLANGDMVAETTAAAHTVIEAIQAARAAGRVLTQQDTALGVASVRPRTEIAYLLDPLPGYFFVVARDSGTIYRSTLMRNLPAHVEHTLFEHARTLEPNGNAAVIPVAYDSVRSGRFLLLAHRDAVGMGPDISHVVAGLPAEMVELPASLVARTIVFILPLVVLLSVIAAYRFSGEPFQRVNELINEVEAITDGRSLHHRVPGDPGEDEVSRLSGTLNAMLSRLEHSFGGLRRFTADASHELKTPLAVLRADVERAMNMDVPAADRMVALEEALQEITRMSDLVDSLLTLARADEGRFDLVREPVHLAPLLEDVLETALILGEEAGLSITAAGITDVVVLGDETRLRHLFLNLLTNAIKYTPRGGRVQVLMQRRPEGDVSVAVRDTGVGIAAVDLPHVFDRFWRADRVRSRATEWGGGGSGLGLSIAQWTAQAHGGSLTVQSRLGRGSVFTVVFPIAPAAAAGDQASAALPPDARVERGGDPGRPADTAFDFTNS